MKSFRFSIIIPTLNEESMLPRLLDSLDRLHQTDLVAVEEIIIVDAGSHDKTVAITGERGCSVIPARPGNVSRSRNLGAGRARGNIVAFLDADCEVTGDWLLKLAEQMAKEGVVATGTALAIPPDSPSWVETTWYELAHRNKQGKGPRPVNWLPSFNLAVDKDVFAEVGGFDETLATCEDVEIGYRLTRHGTLRKIESECVIHHGESKTLSAFFRREAWRSRGSIGILARYWTYPRELVSFVLPFLVMGLLTISLLGHKYGLWLYYQGRFAPDWGYVVLISLGPLLLLLIIAKCKVRPRLIVPAVVLLCLYFSARCVGTLRPFGRVARTTGDA